MPKQCLQGNGAGAGTGMDGVDGSALYPHTGSSHPEQDLALANCLLFDCCSGRDQQCQLHRLHQHWWLHRRWPVVGELVYKTDYERLRETVSEEGFSKSNIFSLERFLPGENASTACLIPEPSFFFKLAERLGGPFPVPFPSLIFGRWN